VRAAAKRRKTADDWAPAFLEAFREHGLIVAACRVAGVSRATVWRRRQADEDFALTFHDADQDVLASPPS
jgi:molybdenum-dependent DNA-binding transcriptional regulator ModE